MSRIYPVILILLFGSCKCPKKAAETASAKQTDTMELNLLLEDNYGGSESEELQVFRSQGELQKFFAGVNKTRKPGLAIPVVDFNEQMVVLYCPGKSNSPSRHQLKAIQTAEKQIVVKAQPSNGKAVAAGGALTMPFSLYTMPRTEKEVVLDQP